MSRERLTVFCPGPLREDSEGRVLQHHRAKAADIHFYIFDLLMRSGRSLLNEPLLKRRDALPDALRPASNKSSVIVLSQTIELGLESVIAKRIHSPYESGRRSGAWVKYKINKGQEFVVGGYTPGNSFDAVIVGYYQGGKLLFAGKVRAGFVPHVRRDIMARMKAPVTEACPFANLPENRRSQWALTREEMKNCHWLKPKLVAQIEFTEWTPDGHLRHAKFGGMRQDKKARDVVREQS